MGKKVSALPLGMLQECSAMQAGCHESSQKLRGAPGFFFMGRNRVWPDGLALCQTGLAQSGLCSSAVTTRRRLNAPATEVDSALWSVAESVLGRRGSAAPRRLADPPVSRSACRRSKRAREDRRPVRHTLYLIYSEGCTSSAGRTLYRTDLSSEAIRRPGRCTRFFQTMRRSRPFWL